MQKIDPSIRHIDKDSTRMKELYELVARWKKLDAEWHEANLNIPEEEIFFTHDCPRSHAALRVVPNF